MHLWPRIEERKQKILSRIDELVLEGADLTRAGVLQCSAANGLHILYESLKARGSSINGKDHTGRTALMIAAAAANRWLPRTDGRTDGQTDGQTDD